VTTPVVELVGVTKRFPGVVANDRVDLAVQAGEVRALLGENGAGKSTLVNILAGLYQPDDGEIRWEGRPVRIRSPRHASQLGVGMVHQHFKLVPSFTATENVMLGLTGTRARLTPREVAQRLAGLGQGYGLQVEPDARVWQLSVGEQQRVEILRQLFMGARLLILDEPTAVLTPQEAEHLFRVLRGIAGQGHGVILITHKLPEVMAVADTITVLRQGKVAGHRARAETDMQSLAALMVGRSLSPVMSGSRPEPGPEVLRLEDVHCLSDRGLPALAGVTLSVRAGTVLGVAGVAGNGQRELADLAAGLRPVKGGRVLVGGRDLTGRGAAAFASAGVQYIPEDRLGTAVAPGLSVWENLSLRSYRTEPVLRFGLMDLRAMQERARKLAGEFRLVAASDRMPVRYLSGGNLQKVVLAREVSAGPRLLVASYPSRGLDVGATELVHRQLLAERDRGVASLLISEDLDELLALADRVVVLYRGRVMGEAEAREADPRQLGLWMAGVAGEGGAAV
jgi:general nucleoside transport system ATP-binding protein